MANEQYILDEFSIDMLKEVGHICSGNATIALSQVINQKIELEIPDLKVIAVDQVMSTLGTSPEVLVGVSISLLGNLNGNVVLMFPEKSAYGLIDSTAQVKTELSNTTEYGVSMLKEIGNIVISAYLATLSTFTRTIILHSTPNLVCGTMDTIFGVVFNKILQEEKNIILVETIFAIRERNMKGSFFFVFRPSVFKQLLNDAKKYHQK